MSAERQFAEFGPRAAPRAHHMPSLLNHIVHSGNSRDPALLLIHPLGADMGFWDECISVWKPGLSCVACDLRSSGASPRAVGPVSIAEHVADLETLRHRLGLEAVVPVGCAIGAMVAALYAANHPHRTSALILSNPALRTTPEAKAMLIERAQLVRGAGMAAILPGAVDKAFIGQPRDDRYARYMTRFAAQDAEGYALSALGILDADVSADLSAIRCPTLVVAGGHDVLLPPAQARAVHGLIPQAQFTLLAEAAHFTPFQRPRQFADLIRDFLSRAGL